MKSTNTFCVLQRRTKITWLPQINNSNRFRVQYTVTDLSGVKIQGLQLLSNPYYFFLAFNEMIGRTNFTNSKHFERFHHSELKEIEGKAKLSLACASLREALA